MMLKKIIQQGRERSGESFSASFLSSAFSFERRPHKPTKQRVWMVWTRGKFRMKLSRDKPGMIPQLDDFHQSSVG